MNNQIAGIAGLVALVATLSGGAYYVYGIDARSQQNSYLVEVLLLDKVDNRLEALKKKETKEGKLDRVDTEVKRELLREKRAKECKLLNVCGSETGKR